MGKGNKRGIAMTTSQSQAIWELWRQGLQLEAEDAANHWDKGETYEPESEVRVSRQIDHLIERCNWEIRNQTRSGRVSP